MNEIKKVIIEPILYLTRTEMYSMMIQPVSSEIGEAIWDKMDRGMGYERASYIGGVVDWRSHIQ